MPSLADIEALFAHRGGEPCSGEPVTQLEPAPRDCATTLAHFMERARRCTIL